MFERPRNDPRTAIRDPRSLVTAVALAALAATATMAQQPPAQPPQGQQTPTQGQRGGARQGQGQGQAQARDRAQLPQGTAAISGRVLTADSGRPVKRARVIVAGGGRGKTTITDDQGRYQIGELASGNYSVTASKSGFVDANYGQRRPLQPGTPVAVSENQAVAGIDMRLTRGGVVTGRVLDEDGEPLARALVTVQRYQYVRGERQLMAAGGDQTDDRGQYRVFGLPPGDYYVSVTANGLAEVLGRGLQQLAAGMGALGGGRGGRGVMAGAGPFGLAGADESTATGYAPTYYPGVVSASDAGKVTVGPGQEAGGIDFQIQLVPFATITGIVVGADDIANVLLVPQNSSPLGPLGGATLNGRAQANGTFTIANVPPGHYLAVARSGGRSSDPKTGMQAVVVTGQNLDGVTIALQPGSTVSGNITVESSGTPAPTDYSSFRIDAPDVNPLPIGAGGGGRGGGPFGGGGRAEKNGSFQVGNLLPGQHYIRLTGQGQGQVQWTLKSVTVSGQDVTDQPIEIKPGQNVDNVTVVLSDRSTELSGTVRDEKGAGVSALTVIAFSTDQQYWRPQSRHILTGRTDQSGAYRIRGLPPGDYLIVAVDDVEQGEWFDPAYLDAVRPSAKRLSLSEGEKTSEDLRGPGG